MKSPDSRSQGQTPSALSGSLEANVPSAASQVSDLEAGEVLTHGFRMKHEDAAGVRREVRIMRSSKSETLVDIQTFFSETPTITRVRFTAEGWELLVHAVLEAQVSMEKWRYEQPIRRQGEAPPQGATVPVENAKPPASNGTDEQN